MSLLLSLVMTGEHYPGSGNFRQTCISAIPADCRKSLHIQQFWQIRQIIEILYFPQFWHIAKKPEILCFRYFRQFRQIYRNARNPVLSAFSAIPADLPKCLEFCAFGIFGNSGRFTGQICQNCQKWAVPMFSANNGTAGCQQFRQFR